jgi:Mg2+ and Co2+ transporter CorA
VPNLPLSRPRLSRAERDAFWFVLAVMGLMLAGLVLVFRRSGWP